MKNIFLSLTLASLCIFNANAQLQVNSMGMDVPHFNLANRTAANGCPPDSTVTQVSGNYQYKWVHQYDGQERLIESVFQNYVGGTWVNNSKVTLAYNAQDSVSETIQQSWDNGAWVNSYKQVYTYNAQNRLIERIGHGWSGSAWGYGLRYNWTYNGQGNVTEETRQDWNGSSWGSITSQTTYTYNGQNQQTGWTRQDWVSNAWQNHSRASYTYNGQGYVNQSVTENWNADPLVNNWVNDRRITNTYNGQNIQTQQATEYWSNNAWTDGLIQQISYTPEGGYYQFNFLTWNNGTWVNYLVWTYYYNCSSTGISDEDLTDGVSVYPNPVADGQLYISGLFNGPNIITLYDMQGKAVIHSHSLSTTHTLDMNALPQGMYILRITDTEGSPINTQRIIKTN